jgi:nitroimidazol reductase NimA-like FMN-containing flavoprotein (pyridoxamine 5'-phosphate oxidase superfamily)
MVIHDLTPAQCREVLRLANLGRLACARDGQPYIVPVFFYFDEQGDCLYSFSTLGQKIDWMRANPKVCVEVDRVADKFNWSTVLVFGRYEEIGDSPRESALRRRAIELFEQRPQWWLPAAGKLASGEEHHAPVVYRILMDRVSGRRAVRPDSG